MLLLPAEKKFEKSLLIVFIHGGGFGGDAIDPSIVEIHRRIVEFLLMYLCKP